MSASLHSQRADRVPMNSGDEFDALTRYRKYHSFQRGEVKVIKRK